MITVLGHLFWLSDAAYQPACALCFLSSTLSGAGATQVISVSGQWLTSSPEPSDKVLLQVSAITETPETSRCFRTLPFSQVLQMQLFRGTVVKFIHKPHQDLGRHSNLSNSISSHLTAAVKRHCLHIYLFCTPVFELEVIRFLWFR